MDAKQKKAETPVPKLNGDGDVMQLLQIAVGHIGSESGANAVGALEKLMDLKERADAKRAEAEFADAFARFQSECPPIPKNKTARIATKGGGSYAYTYADLAQVEAVVKPRLAPLGFSYAWDCESDTAVMKTVCTLRHKAGHRETATFQAPVDSGARMSGSQAAAAALTFAKRQSLLQVLGIATADTDVDGAVVGAPNGNGNGGTINAEQAAHLEALLSETKAPRDKFLSWLRVKDVGSIPAALYTQAADVLERRQREASA